MAASEPTGTALKLLRQVEYYFSQNSMMFDDFLQKEAKEGEGFVQVSTIAGFAKMKALTTDIATIVAAIELSDSLVLSGTASTLATTTTTTTTATTTITTTTPPQKHTLQRTNRASAGSTRSQQTLSAREVAVL